MEHQQEVIEENLEAAADLIEEGQIQEAQVELHQASEELDSQIEELIDETKLTHSQQEELDRLTLLEERLARLEASLMATETAEQLQEISEEEVEVVRENTTHPEELKKRKKGNWIMW